jgi:hypothetical protein
MKHISYKRRVIGKVSAVSLLKVEAIKAVRVNR